MYTLHALKHGIVDYGEYPIQYQPDATELAQHIAALAAPGQSIDKYEKQRAAENASDNIMMGKMGELFAAHLLYEIYGDQGFPLIKPDMVVYGVSGKSYSPDLIARVNDEQILLNVKTARRIANGSISWVFEDDDPVRHSPQTRADELIVFVEQNPNDHHQGYLHYTARVCDVCDLFAPMRKSQYKFNKSAIYASDIRHKLYPHNPVSYVDEDGFVEICNYSYVRS